MRILTTGFLLVASASALAIVQANWTPVEAQSAPVETGQTPQQADQSREQDRSRAEDVRIGRDWKAQEGENSHAGAAPADKDHETVGRDWRAHPDKQDH
jgi:hypothetical protein